MLSRCVSDMSPVLVLLMLANESLENTLYEAQVLQLQGREHHFYYYLPCRAIKRDCIIPWPKVTYKQRCIISNS